MRGEGAREEREKEGESVSAGPLYNPSRACALSAPLPPCPPISAATSGWGSGVAGQPCGCVDGVGAWSDKQGRPHLRRDCRDRCLPGERPGHRGVRSTSPPQPPPTPSLSPGWAAAVASARSFPTLFASLSLFPLPSFILFYFCVFFSLLFYGLQYFRQRHGPLGGCLNLGRW